LRWGNIYAQVSLNNSALTGVTIIDANLQTPLAHQTVLITHSILSNILNNGSKPIPYSFNIINIEGKYLPTLITFTVSMKYESYYSISDLQKNCSEI
jgi:hypothetical protein